MPFRRYALKLVLAFIAHSMLVCSQAWTDDRFEVPPINYSTTQPDDPVSRLQDAIGNGKVALSHDEQYGYLKSVLDALKVPVDSQVLVFSKTSFQSDRITPKTPRAVYFNDDIYVGTVQGGDILEISTADPKLGAVFYTLSQRESPKPEFIRQNSNCLQCHASTLTDGNPGHILRSLYVDERGFPILKAGTRLTTPASPFEERWGGWYVTGTHGSVRHMGNVIAQERERDATVDMEAGANRVELDARVNSKRYLAAHSDIVALLVLAHQTHVHNMITRANFETQYALQDQAVMDEILKRDPTVPSESTQHRIAGAGNKLIEAMICADEVALHDPVHGTSIFAINFAEAGQRDKQGRSLRELDLKDRLFTYPLSYLIYSPQFAALPHVMKEFVYRRLWEIFTATDTSDYPRLPLAQRQAIREILTDTLPDLPDYWKTQN